MADLTHVLVWDSDTEYFKCRTGACSFIKTERQLKKAGYLPIKTHTVFVKEDDFSVSIIPPARVD